MLQTEYFFLPPSFSIALLSLVSLEETIRKADGKQCSLIFLRAKPQICNRQSSDGHIRESCKSAARKAPSGLKLLFYKRHF